ncbi:MAG TPA: hypothetical protein DDW54_00725, partial [Clostridiales bacterium]|nr:hypothetical protein [Clostridiales bacterium]
VYSIDAETHAETEIAIDGSYEKTEDVFSVTYKSGASTVTVNGYLGVYGFVVNGETVRGPVFVKMHEEVTKTYISEKDWSVLVLDNLGQATKYSEDGKVEIGRYILINDELFYYENNEDSSIYKYYSENNTIEKIKFSSVGYYTDDLDSIVFEEYGFVTFGDGERCFYNIEDVSLDENTGKEKGVVAIYKQDANSPDASSYGFVREVFGEYPFERQKIYGEGDDRREYRINRGSNIIFAREETNADKYPLPLNSGKVDLGTLSFGPSGEKEFTVNGTLLVDGKAQDCTVVGSREDGTLEISVIYDVFSFDITVSYEGEDEEGRSLSKYSITGMQGHSTLYPFDYLEQVYLVSLFYGPQYVGYVENDSGIIDIVQSYDDQANETSRSIDAVFLEGSEMFDSEGNLIQIEGATYVVDEDEGIYKVSSVGDDGYTYKIYFTVSYHNGTHRYSYFLSAFTREQTITGDGYVLKTERNIASMGISLFAKEIYSASLSRGEEEYEYYDMFVNGEDYYYVSKTQDDDGSLGNTRYFRISLTENPTAIIGNGEKELVPLYADNCTVTEVAAKTLYTENNKTYADILESENKVVLLSFAGTIYYIEESVYDENNDCYIVSDGMYSFKISVGNDVAEIEEVSNSEN